MTMLPDEGEDLVQFLWDAGRQHFGFAVRHQHRVLDADVQLLLLDVDDRLHRDHHAGGEGHRIVADVVHSEADEVAGRRRFRVGEAPLVEDGLRDLRGVGAGRARLHRGDDRLLRLEHRFVRLQLLLAEGARHRPGAGDIHGLVADRRAVVHDDEVAVRHLPVVAVVVPDVDVGSGADDRGVGSRFRAALDERVGRLGLQLVLVLAGGGRGNCALDALGADPAGAAQRLDLALALDHAHVVDERRDVLELVVGIELAEAGDAPRVLGGRAADAGVLAPRHVESGIAAAGVHFVALRQSQVHERRRGHAPAREELLQVDQGMNAGEAALLGDVRGEPVGSVHADLGLVLPWQEEERLALGEVHDEHGVHVLVAGEIEEVVVLPEADARRVGGGGEHQQLALANRLAQRRTARGEFLGRIADALGVGCGGAREQAGQGGGRDDRVAHGACFTTLRLWPRGDIGLRPILSR